MKTKIFFSLLCLLSVFSVLGQPANDACADATALTYGTGSQAWLCGQTNVAATATGEPAKPACWLTATSHTVWYKVTLPAGQTTLNVTLDNTSGTLKDSQVEVFSGACGSLTSVGCDEDGGIECNFCAHLSLDGLTAGATYLIRVDGYSTNTGTFCIKANQRPPNDCFANATSLTAGTTVNGSIYGARSTSSPCGSSDCGLGGANSVIDCGAGAGASIENSVYYLMACATTASYTVELTNVTCNGTNGLQLWGAYNQSTCSTWNGTKQTGGAGQICDNTASVRSTMTNTFDCAAGQTVRLVVDGFAGELCTFGIVYNTTVLPIAVKSFSLALKEEQVLVQWLTASEKDNDYFIIEKSLDGRTFVPIARVKGAGTSQEEHSYQIYDSDIGLSSYAYYRLKQVDFDGTEHTYSTEYILYNQDLFLKVAPNPTRSDSELYFYSGLESATSVTVKDSKGKLVYMNEFVCSKGDNVLPLDFNSQDIGVYFLTLTTGDKVLKTKIIKTE